MRILLTSVAPEPGSWRRRGGLAVPLLMLLLAAGCRSAVPAPAAPDPSVRRSASMMPSPSASTESADQAAVDAAYRAFWRVSETFDQRPEKEWRSLLGRVAAEPQLGLILANTHLQKRLGITVYGHVVAHPRVGRINGASRVGLIDCQDASNSGQADAKTRRPRTVGVARNPIEAVLVRGADSRWRVSAIKYPGGSC